MKKISRALCVFLSGIATRVFAATEFENGMVPVELVTEFNGGGSVYSSLPDGFPVASGLAGLPVTMIGSIDRSNGSMQQVLLRSNLGGDDLRATILAAYNAEGWIDISSGNELAMCRDDHGQIYFKFTAEATGTRIGIARVAASRLPPQLGSTCLQLKQIVDAQKNGVVGYPVPGLRPELALPAGAMPTSPVIGFINGMGSSTTIEGTRYELNVSNNFQLTDYSVSQLFQHLASQLQAQGWKVDSDSIGTKSAVSAWFNTLTYMALDGKTYEVQATGFLRLVKKGTDSYEFSMDVEGLVPIPAPSVPIIARPIL